MDLTNRGELINYLKDSGLWAKKSLGQNFLVDKEELNRIIKTADLKSTDTVLEIGSGLGTLTQKLSKYAGRVIAVEKDDKMAELLNYKIQSSKSKKDPTSKTQILNRDILELDVDDIIDCHPDLPAGEEGSVSGSPIARLGWTEPRSRRKSGMTEIPDSSAKPQNDRLVVRNDRKKGSYKLVANIPYYITSKILEKFLTAENKPELIVLLVQKEVAERICAKPGKMSVLSVAVQYYGQPEIIKIIKASSFFPEPKIDSAILRINLKPQTSNLKNMERALFKIVRAGFHARRKTLVNNLMVGTNLDKKTLSDILNKIGLSNKVRAQELSISQWQTLTNLTQTSNLKPQTFNSKL